MAGGSSSTFSSSGRARLVDIRNSLPDSKEGDESAAAEEEALGFAGLVVGVAGEDLDGDGDELEGWGLKTCKNRERPVGFNFFFSFLLMMVD